MKKSRYVIAMIVGAFAILVGLFNTLRPDGNVLSGVFTGLGGVLIVVSTFTVDRKVKSVGRPRDELNE